MKISSSTLGMDAIVTHRDVQIRQGTLTAAAASGSKDIFQLQIPGIISAGGRQEVVVESSSCHAVSTVSGEDGAVEHERAEKRIVGRVVSEILNQEVNIREFEASEVSPIVLSDNSERNINVQNTAESKVSGRVNLSLEQIQYSEEKLSVRTTGTVETVDGRSINLGLELELQRLTYSEQQLFAGLLSARFIDPLVLSFEDGLDVIGNSQFSFDLDNDGTMEKIGSLSSGSGFLVLDKNSDGLVNNGSELFGPVSGYGYDELRFHDTDSNNWIDENDEVFDRLQLWMGGGSDEGRLIGLREAGVGALSLASIEAGFQLKATDGRVLGEVRNSGIFLTEDGTVRPLAEIDLAVNEENPTLKWPDYSEEMQQTLRILREMIVARRRRLTQLALQAREESRKLQKERLLDSLFVLREEEPGNRR